MKVSTLYNQYKLACTCTTIGCGLASGIQLSPYIAYKAKHLYDTWGPAGTVLHLSGMESANLISWFKKMFLKQVEQLLKDGTVILFVDGHHSYISLYLAQENNVHLTCLPPNLSHILVSVFHPMKHAYFKILKEYKLVENVMKAVFLSL